MEQHTKNFASSALKSFGAAVATCLRKYSVFTGRASRSEYWFFFLFSTLVIVSSMVAVFTIGVKLGIFIIAAFIVLCICLALVLPNMAVAVRRYHDAGLSGMIYASILGVRVFSFVVAVVLYESAAYTNYTEYNNVDPDELDSMTFGTEMVGFVMFIIAILATWVNWFFLCQKSKRPMDEENTSLKVA